MSLDLILLRLPKPPRPAATRAGIARAFRAHCPACGGHGMPLSLAETKDGLPLIHCFSGCEAGEVLQALGLDFADVLQQRMQKAGKGNGGPTTWGSLAAALDALHQAHCLVLAACSPSLHSAEIEDALAALLGAGEVMGQVKNMARKAMREGAKA